MDWNGDFGQGWDQWDRLQGEHQFIATKNLAEKMLADARAKKNYPEWTLCLIRIAKLRLIYQNAESAIRFLKAQSWPDDFKYVSILNLYKARLLAAYHQVKPLYNRTGTRDQVDEEIGNILSNAWNERRQFGEWPNARWKDIDLKDYPYAIRSSLRDSISYMWVEMLADNNAWQPDQRKGLNRSDLQKLVGGNVGEVALINPAVHPLDKICFILSDLENWHAQRGEREAALEARLERYRILHRNVSDEGDRKYLQSALEKLLAPVADSYWWAEGMAQLADFIRSGNEPDSLVRARKFALRGEGASRGSVGRKRCREIQNAIEQPDYSLAGIQTDNPGKKSLLLTHKNLEKIFFRAYRIDLPDRIEGSGNEAYSPSDGELEYLIKKASPSHKWEAILPATPDYRMHRTFVAPPMIQPGVYLLVASARPGFPKYDNKLFCLYMTIGNLAIISHNENGNLRVTVLTGDTGRPVAGAEVIIHQYGYQTGKDLPWTETKISDQQGLVNFSLNKETDNYYLLARSHGHVAYDVQDYRYNDNEEAQPLQHSTILYTDRSIYRPLQKIFWKAVLYKHSLDGVPAETVPDASLTISLEDQAYKTVESKAVTTNSSGSASGEFIVPSGRAPGSWRLTSSSNGYTGFQVNEYRKPAPESQILDPAEPLRLNSPARIQGRLAGVLKGKVQWSVKRQAGFYVSSLLNDLNDQNNLKLFYPFAPWVASGTAPLKEDGSFSFTFLPEADKIWGENENISYQFLISANATDEIGKSHSIQRSFSAGSFSVDAYAWFDKYNQISDAPKQISVFRTGLDRKPKAGKGIWKIVRLKAPSATLLPSEKPFLFSQLFHRQNLYHTAGDLERGRWSPFPYGYDSNMDARYWEDGAVQASGSILHDAEGKGSVSVPPLEPGVYRLIYETTDDLGSKCEKRFEFFVAAASISLPVPMALFIENAPAVGEKARIWVHSGFEGQYMFLDIYRGGKCIRREEIIAGKHPSLMEIPITEEDRGGFKLALNLLRDNQLIRYYGSVIVRQDDKKLNVEFSSSRNRLQSGGKESWTVQVTDPAKHNDANPSVELLACMQDSRLEAPYSSMNPLRLFYAALRPGFVEGFQVNLSQINGFLLGKSGFNSETVPPSFFGNRMAARGEPPTSYSFSSAQSPDIDPFIPFSSSAPPDSSRDFEPTAFWLPHLRTGPDGSAAFDFTVPDAVASWKVCVIAITKDFRLGFACREVQTYSADQKSWNGDFIEGAPSRTGTQSIPPLRFEFYPRQTLNTRRLQK